jgi:hypothetical protein
LDLWTHCALGAALGPVIGGSLVQINWRLVFWINVPAGLAAVVLAVKVVPESKDDAARGRPDLIGAGLLAAAVGLLALALVKAPGWGWGSAGFIGLLAASLACGTAMVYLIHLLPVQLLGGAGVGLTIPSLLGAGSTSLTPARFGTGSGILNTARQVGTVLGVAGLVAILSRVSRADPVAAYREGLVLIIGFFAAAGVVSAALLTARAVPAGASRLDLPRPSLARLGSARLRRLAVGR